MWAVVGLFFFALALHLIVVPVAQANGVMLTSPHIVRKIRVQLGYHVHRTVLQVSETAKPKMIKHFTSQADSTREMDWEKCELDGGFRSSLGVVAESNEIPKTSDCAAISGEERKKKRQEQKEKRTLAVAQLQSAVSAERRKQLQYALKLYDNAAKNFLHAGDNPLMQAKHAHVASCAAVLRAHMSGTSDSGLVQRPFVFEQRAADHDQTVDTATHSRYTAVVTEQPSQFVPEKNRLLVQDQGHDIMVMICVTMYNEDSTELGDTLLKIARNIRHMQKHGVNSEAFDSLGNDIWKHIVTTVVSDGRTKMNPDTLEFLDKMGLVSEEGMGIALLGDDRPQLHLFEGHARLIQKQDKSRSLSHKVSNLGFMKKHSKSPMHHEPPTQLPMQMQIAIKEHNAGKLNSHLWAFRALVMCFCSC
jgi:hypothetical protein